MKKTLGPILIVGFGSVGRRHFRNLQALGYNNFVLYRTGKSTLSDKDIADIPTEYDIDKALAYKPVATIIANPTALHMQVALAAARAGSHLFIEKPISHTMTGVKELQRLARAKHLVVQIGYQFRFNPMLVQVKQLLAENAIGQVVSVQAHWGEYLPNWHPGEEYRKSYSAREDLGGGALLTMCHPFDYLRWLFGEVASVFAAQGKSGGLDIAVEDAVDVILNFTSGVMGNVHLDYLERPQEHYIRIIGQKGVIYRDLLKSDRNTMFVAEMRHFLECISQKKQPMGTLEDGMQALRIILAAKKSGGKRVIAL